MSAETHARPSVLVVDDEAALAELYAEWLREHYDVTAVSSGEDALDALTPDVDVILLDRNMPGLSGDDVLVTLRNRGFHCRVVLVTGDSLELDIVDLGFDDYLQKPVEPDDLVAAVERLLDRDPVDDLRGRLSSLQITRNIMELEIDDEALAADDAYRTLCDRIGHLEAELSERREAVSGQTTD